MTLKELRVKVTPMPPAIAVFAQEIAAVQDIPEALLALRAHLDDAPRGLQLAYFTFDARRQVVAQRYRCGESAVTTEQFQVSLDHLPAKLRRDLINGATLVDFGEQSADYLRFFGMQDPSDAYLLMLGIRAHGELCGLVAIREPRQRFASRIVERLIAPVGVFALGVMLWEERAARKHAEESLEQILAKVRAEHGQAVHALQRELEDARRQLTADGTDARIAELQRTARDATERAKGAAARLQAVEQQVATAVAQLEKAHVDLSRQSEALRGQGVVLHRVQRLLAESPPSKDPRQIIEEVLAAVSAER